MLRLTRLPFHYFTNWTKVDDRTFNPNFYLFTIKKLNKFLLLAISFVIFFIIRIHEKSHLQTIESGNKLAKF